MLITGANITVTTNSS